MMSDYDHFQKQKTSKRQMTQVQPVFAFALVFVLVFVFLLVYVFTLSDEPSATIIWASTCICICTCTYLTFERQKMSTKQTTQVRPLFGRGLKMVFSPDNTISTIQLNIPAMKFMMTMIKMAMIIWPIVAHWVVMMFRPDDIDDNNDNNDNDKVNRDDDYDKESANGYDSFPRRHRNSGAL